jgi:hypothetical protein
MDTIVVHFTGTNMYNLLFSMKSICNLIFGDDLSKDEVYIGF